MASIIVPLASHHDRNAFDCGKDELNDFLRRLAGQYGRKDFGRTYIAAASPQSPTILGYHAVAVSSVPFQNMGANLPRHAVPVLHLGRLAVDTSAQGQGVGQALLVHALALAQQISELAGVYAVEVVALDGEAQSFYEKHGFTALPRVAGPGDRVRLYLPLKQIRQLNLPRS